MTTEETIKKLKEMKLPAFADGFRSMLQDPETGKLEYPDVIGMLVDLEYDNRKSNSLTKLIKKADFEIPEADIHDINYISGRKLDRDLIHRLASGQYLKEGYNVFITGATGCGKSYLACALGMEACKQYKKVSYVRLPDLLLELSLIRHTDRYKKALQKYVTPQLLIFDEWMLMKPDETDKAVIYDLLSRRRRKSSTIFCSQYRSEGWREILGTEDDTLADAIIDRIIHDAYKINIEPLNPEKDISMREVYGLKKSHPE